MEDRAMTPVVSRREFVRQMGLGAGAATLAGLVLGKWAPGAGDAAATATPRRPNILFILADDLGYQSIGAYGGKTYRAMGKDGKVLGPVKTPNIDALAQGGLRFDYCFSCPVCSPTRSELLTGKYNFRTGFHDITGRNGATKSLDPQKHPTLAATLKAAGYDTAVVGKWHLGPAGTMKAPPKDMPPSPHVSECGFDEQFAYVSAHLTDYGNPQAGEYTPDRGQEWALKYLDSRKGKNEPFFLYYASPVPHTPLRPTPLNPDGPEEGVENFPFILEYFDRQIGELVRKLEELGLRDNTLIFFAGDNGTAGVATEMQDGRTILPGKASLKDTGSRVPLIANWPAAIAPGTTYAGLVDFTDIMPSCLELAGARAPEGIDGVSFAPQLLGRPGKPREWVHVLHVDQYFVRDGKYKLRGDGTLYDITQAPQTETQIPPEKDTEESKAARQRLQAVAEQLHPGGWRPPAAAVRGAAAKKKSQ